MAQDPYTDGSPGFIAPPPEGMTFKDVGSYGLRQFGGWVREDFLAVLVGRQGARVYREMLDNSAVVGSVIFAITQALRRVEWRVNPADDTPAAAEMAEFVDSLRDDCSHTWEDFVTESLSMLGYGYSVHEMVYKRRLGPKPPEGQATSKHKDGRIGLRRLPIRGQDTILKWMFDPNGQITGVTQQPWVGAMIDLPIQKMLLFRPTSHKNNPEGRALDPQTKIPTPDGWRILDDLQIGSKIFDECGRIRYVTARAEWRDRPCYNVTFGDGSEIIADAEHLWVTQNLYERTHRKNGQPRSTAEIANSVKIKSKTAASNHSIEWAAPLDYPEQLLPLDPYFLGLWLGDGTSLSASISCHVQDAEETATLIRSCGYEAEVVQNGSQDGNGRLIRVYGDGRWNPKGPQSLLSALGIRGDKHIPAAYMRGSVDQRRALLAGLMDSDGHADNYGRCEFVNCNVALCQAVLELVRSLGCGASTSLRHRANGKDRKQDSWVVRFRPSWSPFRLSRKVARARIGRARDRHYIAAVEPVASRRTVCIEVDSPSHLFLAGESMVPTHNSILRNSYRPYYFIKRMEEQEAVLFERLSGLPVLRVPSRVLEAANAGDPIALAALTAYKRMVTNIRIDEQMGILLPSDTFPGPNGPSAAKMYDFELVSPQSGGRSGGVNADNSIKRYNLDILKSVLADFIDLGHQARGTQNLAISKTEMFYQASDGWLGSMAAVLNRHMIPRLWDLNAFDPDLMPELQPDMPQRVDLDMISNFVLRLSQAGMEFADEDADYLRDAAGFPEVTEDEEESHLIDSPGWGAKTQTTDNPDLDDGLTDSGDTTAQKAAAAFVRAAVLKRRRWKEAQPRKAS